MLLRFAAENFLSFKEPVIFSMAAGKSPAHASHIFRTSKHKVLKAGYIFGPNASGKSNLIKAIDFARMAVVDGLQFVNTEKKYFRIDPACASLPGVFQFDFLVREHLYSYGFALVYDTSTVVSEWLVRGNGRHEEILFQRDLLENGDYQVASDVKIPDHPREQIRFASWKDDYALKLSGHQLMLHAAKERLSYGGDTFRIILDACDWFSRMQVIFPASKFQNMTGFMKSSSMNLSRMLAHMDTGIEALRLETCNLDAVARELGFSNTDIFTEISKVLKRNSDKTVNLTIDNTHYEFNYENDHLNAYRILIDHGNHDDLFDFGNESDGTQRLFDLLPVLETVRQSSVILIDEIDRSLHARVIQEFIELFWLFGGLCGYPLQEM